MSGTQDSIGIVTDSNADSSGFEKPSEGEYAKAAFLQPGSPVSGGPRKTSKKRHIPLDC